jgi:hypothetical protein
VTAFACIACGHEIQADHINASLICDHCGAQVSIPGAQAAVPVAASEDDPFRDLRSTSPAAVKRLPESASEDNVVPLAKMALPDPLPLELKALGDPIRNFSTANKMPSLLIGGGILAILLAGFVVVLAIVKITGPAGRVPSPIGVLTTIVGLATLGCLLLYLGRVIDWQARISVFRKGFAHIKRDKIVVFPYDDIVAVWQTVTKHYLNYVYIGTTYNYHVRGKGCELLLNNGFPNVQWIGERIQKEVIARQLPLAIQTLNQRGTVRFGRLSVSPDGIGSDGMVLPWNEVEEVQVEEGIISVRKHGKWLNWGNIKASEVPNVFVFIALVDQIIGINKINKQT